MCKGFQARLDEVEAWQAQRGHRVVPVKFFHFVPAKLSKAKPSLRSPFMQSGRLHCTPQSTLVR